MGIGQYLVNVVLREGGGVSVDGPVLGVGEGLLLAEAAQVDLAAAGRVVAGGASDVAPLTVPERGLRARSRETGGVVRLVKLL